MRRNDLLPLISIIFVVLRRYGIDHLPRPLCELLVDISTGWLADTYWEKSPSGPASNDDDSP
jgi:hypothetical protein